MSDIEQLIDRIEAAGLRCDVGSPGGGMYEARIWRWPDVIGRYRTNTRIPYADMLRKALISAGVDCENYTERSAADALLDKWAEDRQRSLRVILGRGD